ncbi:MAG: ribonuclease III domain-containing protein [Candidatus Rifleibacteriota bacterium]
MFVDKNRLMGSDLFALQKAWNKEEIEKLPGRTLAYIGDAVYELGLRLMHVRRGIDDSGRLHDSLVEYVSATGQAKVFNHIFPELSEKEQSLVKTWRNAKLPSRYGSGTKGEYARATALEAWVAYLFLTSQNERLQKLLELVVDNNE